MGAKLSFTLSFVALAGLPPLAGFTTKLFLFTQLLESTHILFWLAACLALLSSVWALFFYLKPFRIYFPFISSSLPSAAAPKTEQRLPLPLALSYLLLLLLWLLFLFPQAILSRLESFSF